jgi:hypothetical protein
MKRLYVRLAADNDFIITMRAFVMAIAPNVLLGYWGNVTKEEIVKLFNDNAFSLYALHQCHTLHAEEYLRSYIQIKVENVYFDDEIDNFTNHNSDGCMAVLEQDDIKYYTM